MVSIQIIQNQDQLKALFQFFARTFYEDASNHQEHYFTMGDRYEEMRKQFCMDPDLLMYIEEDGKIIALVKIRQMFAIMKLYDIIHLYKALIKRSKI